ncbi:MAG: hypothetical protein A2289_17945 [Deltaproteobacteria bacterium RIFOXYA12_FULL_58_15]|nr:MAG: hypothetical protein A2289_17945 [Deltaproteobacteria bacterium RIFOXYA12_FULL_58_15]
MVCRIFIFGGIHVVDFLHRGFATFVLYGVEDFERDVVAIHRQFLALWGKSPDSTDGVINGTVGYEVLTRPMNLVLYAGTAVLVGDAEFFGRDFQLVDYLSDDFACLASSVRRFQDVNYGFDEANEFRSFTHIHSSLWALKSEELHAMSASRPADRLALTEGLAKRNQDGVSQRYL